jgi:hypothetical protein
MFEIGQRVHLPSIDEDFPEAFGIVVEVGEVGTPWAWARVKIEDAYLTGDEEPDGTVEVDFKNIRSI